MNLNLIDEENFLSPQNMAMIRGVLDQAVDYLKLDGQRISLDYTFVDKATIQALNLEYRGLDRPTDVLTFTLEEVGHGSDLHYVPLLQLDAVNQGPIHLGDIIVAVEMAYEQAEEYQHSFERELAFLVVHGFLHALGYDHITPEEEKEMFTIQERVLAAYGLQR